MFRSLRHRRTRVRLDAYADHELTASSVPSVERHLAECPLCRRTLEMIGAVKRSLRRLGRDDPAAVRRLEEWARRELCGHRDHGA